MRAALLALGSALAVLAAACSSPGGDPRAPGGEPHAVVGLPAPEELWIAVREGPRAAAWSADELAGAGLVGRDARGVHRALTPAELSVGADVLGRLAVVRVRQAYAPLEQELVDAALRWPLAEHAVVTDFVLELGARRIRGVVREREEAERLYAAARRQGLTATLVDAQHGVLHQPLGALPAGVPIALELEAFHDLPWVDGWCELDLALGAADARLELDVRVDAAVEIAELAIDGLAAELEREGARGGRLRFEGSSPGGAARVRYRVEEGRAQQALIVGPEEGSRGASFCLVAYPPDAAGRLALVWPGGGAATLSGRHGTGSSGTPVVVLGRLHTGGAASRDTPRCRWSDDGPELAAHRVDVPDGPLARALTKAGAREDLCELQRRGVEGLGADEVSARLDAFRALALEHGLVTFCTSLVLVDARSGDAPPR